MARGLEADRLEGEGVIGLHPALILAEEEFVVGLVGRQEAHPFAIEREAVERAHAEHRMDLGVVAFLHPRGELAVESFERGEVEFAGQKLVAHGAKKPLHFALRRTVPDRSVMEDAARAGADLHDFLGAINGAVIHIKRLRDAALVKGGAQGLGVRVDVFGGEELAVSADARAVVDKGDEAGLHRLAGDAHIRAAERVGLPHFIRVGLGESEPALVFTGVLGREQLVLLDDAPEGVGSDLLAGEMPLLNAETVNEGERDRLAAGPGLDLADGIKDLFEVDLAHLAFVATDLGFHDGDAVFFIA